FAAAKKRRARAQLHARALPAELLQRLLEPADEVASVYRRARLELEQEVARAALGQPESAQRVVLEQPHQPPRVHAAPVCRAEQALAPSAEALDRAAAPAAAAVAVRDA